MVVENLPAGVVAEIYSHKYKGAQGLEVHLANLAGGMVSDGARVPILEKTKFTFPDIKKSLPDPTKPIQITVRGKNIRNAVMLSPDFDGIYELPVEIKGDVAVCRLPTFSSYLLIYFNQGDNKSLYDLPGMQVRTGQPVFKTLQKNTPPMEGVFDPQAVIAFMDSPGVTGGWPFPYQHEYTRFMYHQKSGHETVSINLNLSLVPKKAVLEVGGIDDNDIKKCAIAITINGEILFSGINDFPNDSYAIRKYPIPDGILIPGENKIVFKNLETWGGCTWGGCPGLPWAGCLNGRDQRLPEGSRG